MRMAKPTPTAEEKLQRLRKQHERILETGVAWMARQAIGDAVLLLLRSGIELTKENVGNTLVLMADGKFPEWRGNRDVAIQALRFIESPPDRLPETQVKG